MHTQNVQFCFRFDEKLSEKAQHSNLWFAACGERPDRSQGGSVRALEFRQDGELLKYNETAFSSNMEQKWTFPSTP
jgi:hypothetical protein